ncbi:MAG TPA: PEP-CTERM sorting domain-containing protein [Deltaproteobacteria bacterium]|nr:PEP-CTERM sorting domain-containing protein [Deltaproteobacteria bacterium]
MKSIINGLCLAVISIGLSPNVYAGIIHDAEVRDPYLPFMERIATGPDMPAADPSQARDDSNSYIPIEDMICMNADGSLTFLMDVSRGHPSFIPNETRAAPPHGAPVPEPATMMLVGFGILGASVFSRQRTRS